jgi:hypothetical protein
MSHKVELARTVDSMLLLKVMMMLRINTKAPQGVHSRVHFQSVEARCRAYTMISAFLVLKLANTQQLPVCMQQIFHFCHRAAMELTGPNR